MGRHWKNIGDGIPRGRLEPRASLAQVEARNFAECLRRGVFTISDVCSTLRIGESDAKELAKLVEEDPRRAQVIEGSIEFRSHVVQFLDEELRGGAKC